VNSFYIIKPMGILYMLMSLVSHHYESGFRKAENKKR
jgi:hypothetical protein